MREHFVDLHFRWSPYVPAGPVAIPAGLAEDLSSAALRLLALLDRAALELAPTPAARHLALGLDEDLLPLYQSQAFEEKYAAAVARPDVILTEDGWRFIEFNVGGAVGDPIYVDLFNSFWRQVLAPSWTSSMVLDSSLDLRADMLRQVAEELRLEPSVALIGCAQDINLTNMRYYDLEVDHLRKQGFEASYYEADDYVAELDRTGRGAPLGIQRFMIQDWVDQERSIDAMIRTRATPIALIAPQSSEHSGNKRLLAALSEGTPWMSAADRSFVDQYVPWTREIVDHAVSYEGASRSLLTLLLEQQERFVIKRSNSGSGHGVHLGWTTPEPLWRELIQKALAAGTWVVQERAESVPIRTAVIDTETSAWSETEAPAIFGPMIFGGKVGGCFVRYDTAATDKMLTLALGSVLMSSACWPRR
ncbi:hypothetical protein [Kribbella sp. NPDC051718]|uniref:hypothetical protein n=1 Tax=Kribbella sp. NPDC051718 TaxID=3155168 RepID=UPI0034188C84